MRIRHLLHRASDENESMLARWRGVIIVAVLFVAVLAGLLLYKHVQVRAELSRIRAAGEPVTPDDLAKMYAVPEGENDTTQLWLAAIRQLDPTVRRYSGKTPLEGIPFLDSRVAEPPLPGQAWPDQNRSTALLKVCDRCLSQLHEAAETHGSSAFLSSFDEGQNIILEHAQNLRTASWLLRLEARIRAYEGDFKAAANSIDAIFSASRSLAREPLVVSQLVRMACNATAREEIEQLLSVVEFSDENLGRFQERLRSTNDEEGLYFALLGERVLGIITMRRPITAGLTKTQSLAYRTLGGDDMLDYLHVLGEIIDATQSSWPQVLSRVREIDHSTHVPKQDNRNLGGESIWSWLRPSVSIWGAASHWGSIVPPFERTARALALNRAADAAIGVVRFRRRNGRLPERLEDLVPEFLPGVPVDPFSGDPMLYIQDNDGYAVYSVGINGSDDGGRTEEIEIEHPLFGEVKTHPADFVFRVGEVPDE